MALYQKCKLNIAAKKRLCKYAHFCFRSLAKIDNQAEALGRLKLAILDLPGSTPYVTPTAARALHSPCCTVQWGTTKIVKFKETYIRYTVLPANNSPKKIPEFRMYIPVIIDPPPHPATAAVLYFGFPSPTARALK